MEEQYNKEDQNILIENNSSYQKLTLIGLTILIIIGSFLFILHKYYSQNITSSNNLPNDSLLDESGLLTINDISSQTILKNWGNISSELGFSLKYPHKEVGAIWGDDGYFQFTLYFSPLIISVDADTEEKLSSDISNLGLRSFDFQVIEDESASKDFKMWVDKYVKNEDKKFGVQDKLLSENITEIDFAGLSGYKVARMIEGPKSQLNLRYTQYQILANKGKFVYEITYLGASSDTIFPESGLIGKKYLERVSYLSEEILKTFVFDNSIKTSITIPKISAPQPPNNAKLSRDKLLLNLRTEPFFDEGKLYKTPNPECSEDDIDSLYFGVDNNYADLHGYDNDGGHTGPIPMIPTFDFTLFEEGARGIYSIDLGSIGTGLSIRENIHGKIEVVGKKYGYASFEISSHGNSCEIVDIVVPTTPYSVGTLPITIEGDLGPFSYDIDGDGVEDFMLSLLHPLLPEKQTQLDLVIEDMKKTKKSARESF